MVLGFKKAICILLVFCLLSAGLTPALAEELPELSRAAEQGAEDLPAADDAQTEEAGTAFVPAEASDVSAVSEQAAQSQLAMETQVEGSTVTIKVTGTGAGLADKPYSFDGGCTWQESAQCVRPQGYTWVPGTIMVKDQAGTVIYNHASVTVSKDAAPPVLQIATSGLTVTVTASDTGSGLAAQAYSFNGGASWQASNTFTASGSQSWVAGTIMVRDAVGNIAYNQTTVSVITQADTTPPSIQIATSGLTVTVTASDAGGLAAQAYSFNGGASWQTSNKFTATGSRSWVAGTIMVRDKAGNINYNRSTVSVASQTDTTPPSIQIATSGLTVTVTASDAGGLAAQAYSFNGGASWQTSNKFTATGSRSWVAGTIMVRDKAGNINYNRTTVSVPAQTDTTPPSIQIATSGLTVTVTASDAGGLAAQAYSFNGGASWQTSNKFTATGSRSWVAGTIMVRDKAGNINYNRSTVSVPAQTDTTPPSMKIVTSGLTVTVTASDTGSGLAAQAYSFNGGASWQTSNKFTATGTRSWVAGTIMVRDKAGNIAYNKTTVTVEIDTTIPTFSCTVSGGEQYVTSRTVTITATDKGGLADAAYSFNGGVTWQKENFIKVETLKTWAPGTIMVRDKAGNVNYNRTSVRVGRIIQVENKGDMAIIRVLEDVDGGAGYPPVQFSFDGGASWQSSNSLTVERDKSWLPGTIQAKDSQGKVNYNGERIDVSLNDPLMVDVSAWQGAIDWKAVRNDNVRYAIIRAVTWNNDNPIPDTRFLSNVKAAKDAGLKVGAYIYTYALNEEQVRAEVEVFKGLMQTLESEGYTLDLPVFVDHEDPSLLTGIPSVERRTELLRLEMVLLDHAGYQAGFYASTSWARNQIYGAALQQEGYVLWIADWRGYNGWGDCDFWQFTNKGQVSGISGNVDLDYLLNDQFR